jgi:DNA-directed RNA polymerase specialized sigma24 family protein
VSDLPPFQRFLDGHRDDVLRFLIASLGRHDADDAFQETFISALRAYERLRPGSNLRAWVLTIAHNKALDVHRARARRPLPVAEVDDAAAPVGRAQASEEAAVGAGTAGGGSDHWEVGGGSDHWERVRALPPRQRAVLTLRYAADLTHGEIALALDCTEEAARRAASDGLKTLRQELSDVPAPA